MSVAERGNIFLEGGRLDSFGSSSSFFLRSKNASIRERPDKTAAASSKDTDGKLERVTRDAERSARGSIDTLESK